MSEFWKRWRKAIRYLQKGMEFENREKYEEAIVCYNRSKEIYNQEEEHLRMLRKIFT